MRKRKNNKNTHLHNKKLWVGNSKFNKTTFFIFLMFIFAITFMTVGFARYGKTINFGGTALLKPDGKIYISNVTKGTHSTGASSNPQLTAEGNVDFNMEFKVTRQGGATYTAAFNITITNDSSYDYVFVMPDYTPSINKKSNGASIDSSYLSLQVSGIDFGNPIPSKQSVTFKITFTFSNPSQSEETYIIDGDFLPSAIEDTSASIYGSVDDSVTGDLRGDKTETKFTITVINTYNVDKTFTLTLDTDKFKLKDENLNDNIQYTVPANSPGTDFDFYIAKIEGTEHLIGTERVGVNILPIGSDQTEIGAGKVNILVDQNSFYDDVTPPVISNVTATVSDTSGCADISWTGKDDESSVKNYTVVVYNSSGTEIKRVSTADDNITTPLTITGLSENTSYYFVVYGTNVFEYSATEAQISRATTSEGYACKSNTITCKWTFNVQINLTNFSRNSYTDTATRGQDYEEILPTAQNNYTISGNLEVKVGTETLNASNYTFSTSTRKVTIPAQYVTGDISITATANRDITCLVEGTKILLANGTYKNIEDVKYTDLLAVYDHINGGITYVYPIWMEKKGTASSYIKITFSDGSVLKAAGGHCLFDVDKREYVDVSKRDEFYIGSKVYKVEKNKLKTVTAVNVENIYETVNFYDIVSTTHYNVIANDLITTDVITQNMNILYKFEDKAVFKRYDEVCTWKKLKAEDFNLPYYLFKGFNFENTSYLEGRYVSINEIGTFLAPRTLLPVIKNGSIYFMVTTSFDKVNDQNVDKFLYKEGSTYTLPKGKVKYYIETSSNKKYNPGDKVKVENSIHFKAIK